MFYITFNDTPSGIYLSQVTDVCRFLVKEFNVRIHLIAFISIRNFFDDRKAIKLAYSDAIVVPMFPGLGNWKFNYFSLAVLNYILRPDKVICRGLFSSFLALKLKERYKIKTVCFDARGAYTAEFHEYDVSKGKIPEHVIRELEKKVLVKSDFRIAVSNELIRYWAENFQYKEKSHVIIPCTLAETYTSAMNPDEIVRTRKELKISEDEILIVYAGSGSIWQSLNQLYTVVSGLMASSDKIKLLLLTRDWEADQTPLKAFKEKVIHKWLPPTEVRNMLLACDYGLLIREKSVTNRVASPVKFAEYLSCGLKVIISEEIGDYSKFVKEYDLGICLSAVNPAIPVLTRPPAEEKRRISMIAQEQFTKEVHKESYKIIIELQT